MDPAPSGLGVMLPRGPVPVDRWHEAPAAFAAIEHAGCSAIWITDHLFWGVEVPEALTFAAVAAAATSHCAVGVGVLQLPLRRTAAVAKAVATLQHVSRGRFMLGLGTGEHEEEYRRTGVRFTTRGSALDAAIRELRDLWQATDDRYSQRPVPPPIPLWVGGRSEPALRRVAAVGDGWLPIFVSPQRFAERNHRVDELLAARDRAPSAVRRGVVAVVAVTGPRWTRDQALAWAAELWGVHPDALTRQLVTGSTDEIVEYLAEYVAAGAEHVVVLPATSDPVSMCEALQDRFVAGAKQAVEVP
jgi:alkanesulfonate monooxygenase SsuD/methylene tetrahydromethanopterin reductase-like flavin-dependent oxidoreductase (luciferase family)